LLLTFTGEDYDDVVNLIFLRARYYSPSLKRFISEDDFPGIPTVPISLNRYIYCRNSPVSYVDPTGHIVWIPLLLIGGFLAGGFTNLAVYHFTTPADQRGLEGYKRAFISGAVAGVMGAAFGMIPIIGPITGGAAAGFFGQLTSNYLEGRPLQEDLVVSTATGGIIGGITGAIVPEIPGLRYRGPAPTLQLRKGWPIGGYVGPNTYRYIYRWVASKILEPAVGVYMLYLSRWIEGVFVPPYPPSGTLVIQLNKRQ